MKRSWGMLALAVVLGIGAATAHSGPYMRRYWNKDTPDGSHWGPHYAEEVPTVVGPWGQPVPVAAPYYSNPPGGAEAARAMLASSVPLELIQQSGYFKDSPIQQVGGQCAGGMCPMPGAGPPGNMICPPGMPPLPKGLPLGLRPPGAVAAVGALTGHAAAPFPVQRTEVRFVGPAGMKITWSGPTKDGKAGFGPHYLEAPARYNFLQASIYRLKLSDIPNRPGLNLYPTLEVVPAKVKTSTFLAHSAVPVSFTEEDFEQVAAGNFVVKVVYLPDPNFQDLAATGPDEVVSSRLEPGVDPIIEAKRRGSILLVVRLGSIDLEAPNTPPMDAPNPFQPRAAAPAMPPQMPMAGMPGAMGPGLPPRPPMVPYSMLNGGQPQLPPMPGMQIPGLPPPGQMLPPPNVPGAPQQGTPLGKNNSPSSGVQKVQYQPTSVGAAKSRPTQAELAGQPSSAWSYNPNPSR